MCYPVGARLATRQTLALEKLYNHLFSTPECDSTSIDHLTHDLVLWLNHHSFDELPDALEYYLADPNSDLEVDLAHLTFLYQWGVQVNIHPLVTIYINTHLAWGKCFISTYGVYPGLYDLLDTPRHDFLAAQLHHRDSTLPRPLLPRSRGPTTIRNKCVALQPHLAPPTPPDRLYICHAPCLSITTSVSHVTSPSIIPSAPTVCESTCPHVKLTVCHTDISVCHTTHQSVCQSTCKSVALYVHTTARPSIIPIHPSYDPSVHYPVDLSMTCLSVTPPVNPVICLSDSLFPSDCLHTILPRPTGLTIHPPYTPVRQTICHCPTICITT